MPTGQALGPHFTRQLEVIHLSDLHFGPHHAFNPDLAPDGTPGPTKGVPSLLDTLFSDLESLAHDADRATPRLVCITGDLTQSADPVEFDRCLTFLQSLKMKLRCPVLVVPGNHDVTFDKTEIADRWRNWSTFWQDWTGDRISREEPWEFARVHDLSREIGAIVLTANSSIYVRKDSPEAHRGSIDPRQLTDLKRQLKAIATTTRREAIRIALVHHHVVLIPPLAEPGRQYDAIVGSGEFLTLLREFGFHVLLHGHKHWPFVFTEDADNGFDQRGGQTMLVLAGGSAGAAPQDLPGRPSATNTYNRLTIKWHPAAERTRVQVDTRGLRRFDFQGTPLLRGEWAWNPLKSTDRSFVVSQAAPRRQFSGSLEKWAPSRHARHEVLRENAYAASRGWMPLLSVRPSLLVGQAYEARFWLVQHRASKTANLIPTRVEWSAGKKFHVISVEHANDPKFMGRYHYWDSMLVQGTLVFPDDYMAHVYVYAYIPEEED